MRLDELSFEIRLERRTTKGSSSGRITVRLVPVFILEMYNPDEQQNVCPSSSRRIMRPQYKNGQWERKHFLFTCPSPPGVRGTSAGYRKNENLKAKPKLNPNSTGNFVSNSLFFLPFFVFSFTPYSFPVPRSAFVFSNFRKIILSKIKRNDSSLLHDCFVGTKHFPEFKTLLDSAWEVFVDSGKCFGFWEVFLDSGKCFGFPEVFQIPLKCFVSMSHSILIQYPIYTLGFPVAVAIDDSVSLSRR